RGLDPRGGRHRAGCRGVREGRHRGGGGERTRRPPDGAMAVQGTARPLEASLHLIEAESRRADCVVARGAGEPWERDPARLAEPDGAPEHACVVAWAPEAQVQDREEPRAADAPEVRGSGPQPSGPDAPVR